MIGGAVIKAARRSAGLSRLSLARRLDVNAATVRAWENGVISLFEVPYTKLRWAVAGHVPAVYAQYAAPGPLLSYLPSSR